MAAYLRVIVGAYGSVSKSLRAPPEPPRSRSHLSAVLIIPARTAVATEDACAAGTPAFRQARKVILSAFSVRQKSSRFGNKGIGSCVGTRAHVLVPSWENAMVFFGLSLAGRRGTA